MSRFTTKEVYVQREPIVVQILSTNFLVFKVLVLSFPIFCMTCFVAGSSKASRIVSVQFFVNFILDALVLDGNIEQMMGAACSSLASHAPCRALYVTCQLNLECQNHWLSQVFPVASAWYHMQL
ncbi:hypothetical protein CY35_13G005800 [Sphagnum magellanicum]|nr:hypothetical protein CY35_13G005800 [Sphagnum magellanicum]